MADAPTENSRAQASPSTPLRDTTEEVKIGMLRSTPTREDPFIRKLFPGVDTLYAIMGQTFTILLPRTGRTGQIIITDKSALGALDGYELVTDRDMMGEIQMDALDARLLGATQLLFDVSDALGAQIVLSEEDADGSSSDAAPDGANKS